MRNISLISIVLVISLWTTYFLSNKLDLAYTITTTGAVMAFWYGYRRYEQDSEIGIMNTFSEKYKEILDEDNDEKIYMRIVDLWYEEFFLYARGYISKNLWMEWEHWIYEDFGDLLEYIVRESQGNHEDIKRFFLGNPICTKLLDYSLYGASDINYFVGVKDSGARKYVRIFRNNTIDPSDMSSYYSYSKVNGLNFFDFITRILDEHKSHTAHLIYTGKIMKQNEKRKYLKMKDEFDESYKDLKNQLFVIEKLTEFLN